MSEELVVVVSRIGKDAEHDTDPNDSVFDSRYNGSKIVLEGTKNVTLLASTNNQSFTQAHGLGFIPLPSAFAKQSGVARVFLPNEADTASWASTTGFGDSGVKFNYITADITNLTFNFDNTNGTTKDIAIRYICWEGLE